MSVRLVCFPPRQGGAPIGPNIQSQGGSPVSHGLRDHLAAFLSEPLTSTETPMTHSECAQGSKILPEVDGVLPDYE